MTETAQVREILHKAEFSNLPKGDIVSNIVKDYGLVYATSITRDGCSGCEEQKPLFHNLAEKFAESHPDATRFSNIHVHYRKEDPAESGDSKRMLGHAAYPTYMVHVKSAYGPLEVYRAVYPKMEELEKQILDALDLAEHYKQEAKKSGKLHS